MVEETTGVIEAAWARSRQRTGAFERPGQAGRSKKPRLDRIEPSQEGTGSC